MQTSFHKHKTIILVSLITLTIFLFSLSPSYAIKEVDETFHMVPAHPDLVQKVREGRISVPYMSSEFQEEVRQRGVNKPNKLFDVSKLYTKAKRIAVSDKIAFQSSSFNVLVVLVEFSDNAQQVESEFFDSLIFNSSASSNSVKIYYLETSYGMLDLVTVDIPSSIGWQEAPQTYSYYVNGNYGMGSYPQNTQKLFEDIIEIIDPIVNFSNYDNDNDGYVEGAAMIHAGPGAEFTGSVDDIWSHKWSISPNLRDGVYVSSYTIQPEFLTTPGDMTIGVFAHEFGHILGLPDLYDIDYTSYGIGRWSLMAYGAWNNQGGSPAHLDAWSKIQLGFVDPQLPSLFPENVIILPAETYDTGIYRLWSDNDISSNEYFLLENRQLIGFDSYLPGSGLLIWHIDDLRPTNTQEWYPGYTSSGHYKVALEQADGLWEMEKNMDTGDAGDPFPGVTINSEFNSTTIPDSKTYAGNDTGIRVENIFLSGTNVSTYISVNTSTSEPPICGDVDTNGKINIIDLVLVIFWQGKNSGQGDWNDYDHLDVNNDTVINFGDVSAVITSFGQSC